MIKSKNPLFTAIIWLFLVTTLLCIPSTSLSSEFSIPWLNKIWLDKWVHVFIFSILVILFCRAIIKVKTNFSFIWIAIIGLIYGIAIELVQHFLIPFRSFELGDIFADAIGCILGFFIATKRFNN